MAPRPAPGEPASAPGGTEDGAPGSATGGPPGATAPPTARPEACRPQGPRRPRPRARRPAGPPAPVPAATLRWSSDRGWIDRGGGPPTPESAALPTLAQLTSPEQRWADREEDITAVSGDPFEVGQVFARRWKDRLPSPAPLKQLTADYPRIPHRIDGELLRYAARFGLLAHKDDQIDERDRYAIRAGFWREAGAPAAAEPSPAAD
ncbi:hypothetical protein E4N63_24845 [Streptomyces sp. MNU89]|nr:hypothetical protein [Streptomyces sp. MNU89]MCC9742096.1 hypothetical protein [Streptomyces sp. MNU89]